MLLIDETRPTVFPRSLWWWLALGLLMILAGWLYYRGYDASLPYIDHVDEPQHLLAAQAIIDTGSARPVFHEAAPPGISRLNYLLLKHIKPADAHHVTMLPALRLITITAWMLAVVVIALLGALLGHPMTGLFAAAIWIVNPWVVQRTHFALPDGYLTLFTLLSLWLALVGCLNGRRSYSTAAMYSIMLAIVFKTTAILVAPIVIFLPLVNLWSPRAERVNTGQQVIWNCIRFGFFLFWLLLLYPTLEFVDIPYWPVTETRISAPDLHAIRMFLNQVLLTFQPLAAWAGVALAGAILLRYRKYVNSIALLVLSLTAIAWLFGMSMLPLRGDQLRQLFVPGAILAILYAVSLTGLAFLFEEILGHSRLSARRLCVGPAAIAQGALAVLLAISLVPSFRESDALAHNFTLHDRRNDLARYMDTSLKPGKYVSDYDNHKTFNRSWGGYDGVHDFPRYQEHARLTDKPIEEWRALGVEYAVMPHWRMLEDPDIYHPDETVLLKTYPVSSDFRGPNMVVLRLFPMQHTLDAQLGTIRYVGYDINKIEAAGGEDLEFRYYWQAEAPADARLHVFNHLLNSDGDLIAQVDSIPLWDARRDTTTWDDADEILLGRNFILKLPGDLPPGTYQLVTGFYDPQAGQRLRSASGEDHVTITEITILSPGA